MKGTIGRTLLTTLIITLMMMTNPANAAIIVGGGSGSTSGGSSSSRVIGMYYYKDITSFLQSGTRWGNSRPVNNTTKFGTNGAASVAAAVKAVQDTSVVAEGCWSPNVKAIFAQETRYDGTRQFVYSVNSGYNWHSGSGGAKFSELLTIYKNNGGTNQQVIDQLAAQGNNYASPNGDPQSIICVTVDPDPDDYKWVEEPVYEPVTEDFTITCDYSVGTVITRQITQNGRDPIGVDNLNNQTPETVKTPFGEAFDRLKNDTTKTVDQIKTELETACANSQNFDPPAADMNEKNRAGIAEGGVLNVTHFAKEATFKTSSSKEQLKSCVRREYVSKDDKQTWTATGKTAPCEENHPQERNVTPVDNEANLSATQKPAGFYQIISLHCNRWGWDELVKATPDMKVVHTDTTGGNFSAVGESKFYPQRPDLLDFGDTNAANHPAKRATGNLGFYDKECAFECVAEGNNANANNKAVDNITDKSPNDVGQVVGNYGAVGGTLNTNDYTVFRNNLWFDIRADIWFPKTTTDVQYAGEPAKTTTIVRWDGGTPEPYGTSGGSFQMKTGDRELFKGGEKEIPTQKNWHTTQHSSKNLEILQGVHNEFSMKADWASESDAPQAFNVKYEYAPEIMTKVQTTGLGFNNGTKLNGTVDTLTAAVEGKCYATFGKKQDAEVLTNDFMLHTGTDTTNNLDGKLLSERFGETETTPKDDNNTLYVEFVRSTTE